MTGQLIINWLAGKKRVERGNPFLRCMMKRIHDIIDDGLYV
jgi:hypothetical protein